MSPRPSVEAERREEVLSAACEVISEVGFRHVRIADVAERIGTSTGIIHYYFRTKEELLQSAFRFMMDKARERSLEALAGVDDPVARLYAVIDVNLPTPSNSRDWPIWIHLWAESLRDEEIRRLNGASYARWIALVQQIVEDGQAQGAFPGLDAREFSTQLLAMMDGLVIQAVISGRPSATRALRGIIHSFVDRSISAPRGRVDPALVR